jgi:methylenetetrahydrofolate reductase (NADPH)
MIATIVGVSIASEMRPAKMISPHAKKNRKNQMKSLRDAIRQQSFALTAELPMSDHQDGGTLLANAQRLHPWVDAIQLTDNQRGRVHASPLAIAAMLLQQGIDPVLHVTCRNRNRIALESDILGAAAIGVTSLVVMRGSNKSAGPRASVKPVFDTGATELIAVARAISNGHVPSAKPLSPAPEFLIGAVGTVFNPEADWKPRGLTAKLDAGAQFVQTQPCFDMSALRAYLDRLVKERLTWHVHLIVGLACLPSVTAARWMRNMPGGALIPDATMRRLEQARDPEREGVAICAELLRELMEIPGVSGVNLMPLGDLDAVAEAVERSGVRQDAPGSMNVS